MFMMESEMATTTMRCLAAASTELTKDPRTCKSCGRRVVRGVLGRRQWQQRKVLVLRGLLRATHSSQMSLSRSP
eukprot:COSAG02_NODE_6307_length_3665_cov_3.765564_5_plen_74_part_00